MCCKANQRLQIFDPYLGVEPFHLYLAEVNDSVEVTVVTSSAIMDTDPTWKSKDVKRRDRIVTISELFSIEHPTSYQFRVTQQQHDRHMRIDNDIFHLGSSFNSAAKKAPYTIGKLDPTQSNHTFLDGVINNAIEWFVLA